MQNQNRFPFSDDKENIKNIANKLQRLEQELEKTNQKIDKIINKILKNILKKPQKTTKNSFDTPIQKPDTLTQNLDNSTDTSTDNYPFQALKSQFLSVSTGNQGVPTDKQTNRQTDKQTHNLPKNQENNPKIILEQLDNIKKDIRLRFKRLTTQEMLIFSTLYQLEEEIKKEGKDQEITYKTISNKLGLSESSIRDYIGRLIKKKIPIDKEKIANKKIILHISEDLKTIASLNTLLKLREI